MNTTFGNLKPGDFFYLNFSFPIQKPDVYLVTRRSGGESGPDAVVRVHSGTGGGTGYAWERHFHKDMKVTKLTMQTPAVFVPWTPPVCKCCGQTMPEGEN